MFESEKEFKGELGINAIKSRIKMTEDHILALEGQIDRAPETSKASLQAQLKNSQDELYREEKKLEELESHIEDKREELLG